MPFFKEIQSQLLEFSEEKIIIGGDFNCTLITDKKVVVAIKSIL